METVFRSSGALAPLFSLPGVRDVGSLGRCARRFVDDLAESGQRWWQMLPINPVDRFGSPYAGRSAFAGEALYLDLEELRDEKLLDDADIEAAWLLPTNAEKLNAANNLKKEPKSIQNFDSSKVSPNKLYDEASELVDPRSEEIDYAAAFETRRPLWEKAFKRYQNGDGGEKYRAQEERFRAENAFWLENYVLFQTAVEAFGTSDWSRWPAEIRRREPAALAKFAEENAEKLEFLRFLQLVFDVQWSDLRDYCRQKSVRLFGDVPIYVGKSSADVWAFPDLFEVDADGRVIREAGVPADDFNPDGQRWGSALYRWTRHRETGFAWWRKRMQKTIARFDVVRLDHFIGFYNFYSFPGEGAESETAKNGADNAASNPLISPNDANFAKNVAQLDASNKLEIPNNAETPKKIYEDGWEPGPQEAFFDAIFAEIPREAFVAEDLGVMNDGVCRLRDRYELPGMKVLQFSFDNVKIDPETAIAPNPLDYWTENYVAYAGTHDAAPILGWLADVEKYGGKNWASLDFAGITNVLARYRRPDDVPAAILGDETAEKSAEKAPIDDSGPTLGVSKRVVPLSPEVANLRTAALRAVAESKCRLAIFPLQDVVGLSNDSRINFPGVGVGNWTWRLADSALTPEIKAEWRRVTVESGRLGDAN